MFPEHGTAQEKNEINIPKPQKQRQKKDICSGGTDEMGKLILYHGTPDKIVVPAFGLGNDKHDYGKGFYLTENQELAKEWAVCRPNDMNGWGHKYERYNSRDVEARQKMRDLVNSDASKSIDEAKAYVITMNAEELWDYFLKTEGYKLRKGNALQGFLPDWIGEFYAYYQWYYNIPSSELIKKVPIEFLIKAYRGLHDLELDLAVKKVGDVSCRLSASITPMKITAF